MEIENCIIIIPKEGHMEITKTGDGVVMNYARKSNRTKDDIIEILESIKGTLGW